MELNEFISSLKSSKYLAINGCDTPDIPNFLFDYLEATTKSGTIKLLNSNHVKDLQELKRSLSCNPLDTDWKINQSLESVIAECIEKEMIIVWDLWDSSEDDIWNILFLNKQVDRSRNRALKFIICGKWEKSKFSRPSSYPISPAQTIYACDLFLTYCDYKTISKLFRPLESDEFKILIDYTGGSLYFISKYIYISDELKVLTLDNYHTHFQYLADNYYNEVKDNTNLDFLKNPKYVTKHKVLLINSEEEENIFGSNLFKVITKDGSKSICKPLNFITDYTLNALSNKERYHEYNPLRPIRYIDKELLVSTLTIELETKHILRELIKYDPQIPTSNYDLLITMDLKRELNYSNYPPKNCREYANEMYLKDKINWDKEDFTGNDIFDYFTFGNIPFYIRTLKEIKRSKSDIDLSIYSLKFKFEKIPKLLPVNTLIQQRNIEGKEILYYFILPDENIYFAYENIDRTKKSLINKLPHLFKNDFREKLSEFADIIEEIIRYRNSTTHLKILSDDTYRSFKNYERKFYTFIAGLKAAIINS
ncbi:MAG: hypothetical protein GX452_04740 [Ignavibacteriales bacterium]|nr:hypothetical protein [Ignavibacteriales bacterium]